MMNINKKYIIFPIVFVLTVWVFNIIRYQIYFLDKPIFIKECVEKNVSIESDNSEINPYVKFGSKVLEFYYIDDFSNNTYITDKIDYRTISFPEINSQECFSSNGNFGGSTFDMFNQGNQVTGVEIYPYRLKVLSVDLGQVFLKDGRSLYDLLEEKKEIVITKIQIGSGEYSRIVDIGNVKIRDVTDQELRTTLVREMYGTSGEMNWSNINYEALRNIKITEVNANLLDISDKYLSVKLNDQDISDIKFPIEIKEGESFKVSYKVNLWREDKNKLEPKLIETLLKVKIIDTNKQAEEVIIPVSNWYYSIAEYLEKAGNLNKLFKE